MKVGNALRYAGVVAAALGLTAVGLAAIAQAQTPGPLKIGVMDGFSGVYGDLTAGEVEAMQMAIDDVGGKVMGRSVEILSADHQTKPDVGAAIARKWYDVDGVSMITGIGTSSVALAVRKIAQEKGKIDINTGAASADLTGPACSGTSSSKSERASSRAAWVIVVSAPRETAIPARSSSRKRSSSRRVFWRSASTSCSLTAPRAMAALLPTTRSSISGCPMCAPPTPSSPPGASSSLTPRT